MEELKKSLTTTAANLEAVRALVPTEDRIPADPRQLQMEQAQMVALRGRRLRYNKPYDDCCRELERDIRRLGTELRAHERAHAALELMHKHVECDSSVGSDKTNTSFVIVETACIGEEARLRTALMEMNARCERLVVRCFEARLQHREWMGAMEAEMINNTKENTKVNTDTKPDAKTANAANVANAANAANTADTKTTTAAKPRRRKVVAKKN